MGDAHLIGGWVADGRLRAGAEGKCECLSDTKENNMSGTSPNRGAPVGRKRARCIPFCGVLRHVDAQTPVGRSFWVTRPIGST